MAERIQEIAWRSTRWGRGLPVLIAALIALTLWLPGSAPAANKYFKNASIARIAEHWPSAHGGQCIRFVREVLRKASRNRVFISAYASGYQGTFKANGGSRIRNPNRAVRGDIIQITPPRTSNSWTGPERMPLHTAIIRQNLKRGWFKVIDSNYHLPEDELIRRHRFNPYEMAKRYGGGTVKIWRLGAAKQRSGGKPKPTPSPTPTPTPSPTPTPAPEPSSPSSPKAPTKPSNKLRNDERLVASKNQYLRSEDGRYRFVMQSDSNLVLYGPSGRALWASNTVGRGADHARMQGDGNLVIYNRHDKPIWASNTPRHYNAFLIVQNDGNVVIYEGKKPLWATGTDGRR